MACVLTGVLIVGSAIGCWEKGGLVAEQARRQAPAAQPEALADDLLSPVLQGDAARLVSRSGDRWSSAYSAREYESFKRALAGEYVGTGIAVVRTSEGRIEVSRVHQGSPAAHAGIRPGDELRTLDGDPLTGRPVTDAVSQLRGTSRAGSEAGPGSVVLIGLERDGKRWEMSVERARLSAESVTVTREAPGVTRVHVSGFVQGAAESLRAAVDSAPSTEGIILDLRGNAGGLLSEATEAASVFLDGGLVATYDVHGSQRALHAEAGGDTGARLVVLVDGGTMSSAELLAGALQDRNRALLVGAPTFGKGTVQMPSEQPDGSVAELTVGHYATPSGRTVREGEGIIPDVAVEPGEDAAERAHTVLSGLAAPG